MAKDKHFNLDFSTFTKIIDNLYDEIIVWDNNYKIAYINKACRRHYGMRQEELVGQNFFDLTEADYWDPSVLPFVYKEKRAVKQKQKTYIGAEILTIAVPILDDNDIQYVAMSVRDEFQNDLLENLDAEMGPDEYIKNEIIYRSKLMDNVVSLANKLSNIDSPCLILGESGTGKSLLAKYMHECSNRKDKPFVNVNCAAIHKDLIESELFGYVAGSFTGASTSGKSGLIAAAEGGTLFLDEIAEIPYHLQSKLLQFIQDYEYKPVGSNKSHKADVKIITATNRSLKQMVDMNKFREDLYYRLNVFEIVVPPLRERREDIITLVYYLLNIYNKKYKKNHTLSEGALDTISEYSWRGNVRELSHIIERLVVTINDVIIQSYHLPSHLYEIQQNRNVIDIDNKSLDEAKKDIEKKMIIKAYEELKSSRKVAEKLSISQTRANRLINKYCNISES